MSIDGKKFDKASFNLLTNDVIINFDVFGSLMEEGIMS